MAIIISSCGPEIFKIKGALFEKMHTLEARDTRGKPRWRSDVKAQVINGINGSKRQLLCLEENASGIYSLDKSIKSWQIKSEFIFVNEHLIPRQVTQEFKDDGDNIIKTIEKHYDQERGEVACQVNGRTKKTVDSQKGLLLDQAMMGIVLANYPFEKPRDVSFHLLTHNLEIYKIALKYRGLNKLMLGDSKIDCYKLEMIPALGIFSIAGVLFPSTYFWFMVDSPHEAVRYEGFENGPTSPRIIVDLQP